MAEWSTALPLTAHCLSPLRACPDGWVVYGIATDCSLSLTTEGLPWGLSGLRRCHWLLTVFHHWGLSDLRLCHWLLTVSHHWGPALRAEWSKALPLTAHCPPPLKGFPNSWVVYCVATDCWLSLTTEGLPWWLSGLQHCHWLITVSHHWGPALVAEWSKALPLTAQSLTTEGLPWWLCGLRSCHWLLAASHHWGLALMAEWSKVLLLTACYLSPLPWLASQLGNVRKAGQIPGVS